MRALFLLTAVSLPLFLNSCALINSAIKLPAGLVKSVTRTITDAEDTTSPATRELENHAQIALKINTAQK
jgi:hypothetical protein